MGILDGRTALCGTVRSRPESGGYLHEKDGESKVRPPNDSRRASKLGGGTECPHALTLQGALLQVLTRREVLAGSRSVRMIAGARMPRPF